MNKGGDQATSGFTIVETMIVLAVTSMLFVSAALLINGRQAHAQFETAINGMQQQLQQIINQTSSGYYPNNGNFTCQSSAAGPFIQSGSAGQGSNGACIFIGNVIRFSSSQTSVPSGTRATEQFTLFPLAGLRLDSTGKEVQSLSDAKPYAIAPGTNAYGLSDSSIPDYSRVYTTQNGLIYAGKPTTSAAGGMKTCSLAGVCSFSNTTVIAFIASFGSYNGELLNSGAQQFTLYSLPGVHTYSSDSQTADLIDCSSSSTVGCSAFTPINSAQICYASGSTNQSGLLTIGNPGSGGLNVSLQIFSNNRQCGFPSS